MKRYETRRVMLVRIGHRHLVSVCVNKKFINFMPQPLYDVLKYICNIFILYIIVSCCIKKIFKVVYMVKRLQLIQTTSELEK